MAGLATIFHALRDIADPAVDDALAAALPTATGRALHVIALTLLERQQHAGLLGLILHYHRLPPDAQRRIIAHAGDLFRPLREASGMTATRGPANAIHVIREALSPRLAYLVTEQLRQNNPDLHKQAGHCLLHLAQRAATFPSAPNHPAPLPAIDAPAAEFLASAIHDAVAAYPRHEQTAVLCALGWLLPRPMPDTLKRLDSESDPAAVAMRALMRQADQPAIRRSLLLLLAVDHQADAAVDGLRQAAATSRLGDALPGFHHLARPAARLALQRARTPDSLWPSRAAIEAMQPHERRGLPHYLDALPYDRASRIARLAALRELDDLGVRLSSLRKLIEIAGDPTAPPQEQDQADDVIARFCDDADESLARIALWHLIRRDYHDLAKVLARLVNSPHPTLRRVAGPRLAPIGFARLWDTWPRLDTPRRLAAGRALMKIDPGFHRLLGQRLDHPDRKSRVRAMAIVAELNQGALFEDTLLDLAQSADTHIASAAVKALGSASDAHPAVIQTLEHALEHDDGRVRANAIEALAQLQSIHHVDQLVQLADDPESRPRANAIAALLDLRTGDAVHALRQMLDDRRPEHRHSALWLIQRVGLLELARHVAELSITDTDAAVRQRATTVVRDLIELMETPVPAAVSGDDPKNQAVA